MTNNDVLRTLRYSLSLDNIALLACLKEVGVRLEPRELAALLKQEDEPGFMPLPDEVLEHLLQGLIIRLRGRREEPEPEPAVPPKLPLRLTNNRILRALRIALALQDRDLITIMGLSGVTVGKAELSALFRREGHRNHQPCGDQFLRQFLRGLATWQRSGRQPA
ncbi:MAG TPA: DUF1456 family protein [Polyangiales bacterium]|nr:DUF1456 family protein [Polyangiales bacterium]